MSKIVIEVRSEPHVAQVGDVELKFLPEVVGDGFLQAFDRMQETHKSIQPGTPEGEAALRERRALREFLAYPMLPESREVFDTLELPDHALLALYQWLLSEEVYGAGRPPMSPSGSVPPSSTPGTPSTASGRSKASTRTRGR